MTQEDKELLLRDLCGRLPYGVVVHADDEDIKLGKNHRGLGVLYYKYYSEEAKKICGYNEEDFSIIIGGCFYGHDIKPYLFPLSSMTEEQKIELNRLGEEECDIIEYVVNNPNPKNIGFPVVTHYMVDWCNKNHFDYRGLIPMGLAIDASGLGIY